MSIWRASFLASKVLALFFLALSIVSLEPATRFGPFTTWKQLIIPGVLFLIAGLLWTLADVFARHIATAAFIWGSDFALREGLEDEEDSLPEQPYERRTMTLGRVDLLLFLLAVMGLILFVTVVLQALLRARGPVNLSSSPSSGRIWLVIAIGAATLITGAATGLLHRFSRRA